MRRRKQLGFLLNPYRFAGTTQSGAFNAVGAAVTTMAGAAIGSAALSADGAATLAAEDNNVTSGAGSMAGAGVLTMVGAANAASNVSAGGTAVATFDATSSALTVDAADFDGTNDYLIRGAMTGQAVSKTGIFSCWFRRDTLDLPEKLFMVSDLGSGTEVFMVGFNGVVPKNPVFTLNLVGGTGSLFGSTVTLATATWYHILASWDLSAAVAHHYLNDADSLDNVNKTLTNENTSYDVADNWHAGTYEQDASFGGTAANHFDGGVAELYFAPGQFLDFSVEANRRRFISSTGKPVNLGATGSTPTGTAPLVYLHLDDGETANNFAINRGTGGNFTVTGALGTHASSPSD